MKKRNPAKAQTSTKYDDRYQDDRLPFSIFIHALVSYVLPPFSLYTYVLSFFPIDIMHVWYYNAQQRPIFLWLRET